jgi:para-nitrobenzyl esterase
MTNGTSAQEAASIVETQYGRLQGVVGDGVRVFKGIPYAEPPIGPLRWQPPQPVKPWTGTRDALEFGFDCPQQPNPLMQTRAPGQSEDCLTLNVWTPAKPANDRLPVMVWFYGGSFVMGSAASPRFDGEFFARDGVVYVTVSYRVGIFGFLAHPGLTAEQEHHFSGNYGMLDQIEALRWIKENVAAFGGDPDNVTVFGDSSGAATISLLMVSPLTEGLFQKAILESPGNFRPLAKLADAEAAGLKLGDDVEELRRTSPEDLLAKQHLLVPAMRGLTTPRILRAIEDGYVVPEDERDLYWSGRFHAVPSIIGTAFDEGTSLTRSWPINDHSDAERVLEENFAQDLEGAKQLYLNQEESPRQIVADMFADTQFNYGAWSMTRALSKRQPQTFRYLFTRRRPGIDRGPDHGGEVSYVFNQVDREDLPFDDKDLEVAKAMHSTWIRFATTGDPNGGELPAWPAYNEESDEVLEFGDQIGVRSKWRRTYLDFLEQYYRG